MNTDWESKYIGEQCIKNDEPEKPKVPWYHKHGVKRAIGTALSTVGGTLVIAGSYLYGSILLGTGVLIGAIGVVHSQIKDKAGIDQGDSIGKAISSWLIATYNLIKCLIERRKKGV